MQPGSLVIYTGDMGAADRMTVNAFGPAEPTGFSAIRTTYWTHRAWVDALESRIMMTDAGLAWLYRVKEIGRR